MSRIRQRCITGIMATMLSRKCQCNNLMYMGGSDTTTKKTQQNLVDIFRKKQTLYLFFMVHFIFLLIFTSSDNVFIATNMHLMP